MNKSLSFFAALFVLCNVSFSQNIGINATGALPNNSAMLDVSSTNKGVLIPNVTLTGPTDAVTIASPATGLLVWNLGAGGGLLPGYYYYNSGTPAAPNWVQLSNTRKYSSIGVTDINTNANSVATAVAMNAMSITFTPQNSTVFLYFSCSGNLGIGACTTGPGAINGYFDLYNGAVKVTGTKCPLGGTDFNGNMSLIWNTVLAYPVAVTPGVSTTLSIRWWRDASATACNLATTLIINNVASGLNGHRTLFILD